MNERFLIIKVKLSDSEKDKYDLICDDDRLRTLFFIECEKYLHRKLYVTYRDFSDFVKYHKKMESVADSLGAELTRFGVL